MRARLEFGEIEGIGEKLAEPLHQSERRLRVGRHVHVVGHVRPYADGGEVFVAEQIVQYADDSGGSLIARGFEAQLRGEVGVRGGAGNPDPASVVDVGEQGAHRHGHPHPAFAHHGQYDFGKAPPLQMRLHAQEHHHVVFEVRRLACVERVRRPGDFPAAVLIEADVGPHVLKIVERVGIDSGEFRPPHFLGDETGGGRGGAAGIVPARESHE